MMTFLGVAFLLFFIAYRPDSAQGAFSALGSTVADIAKAIGNFIDSLIA